MSYLIKKSQKTNEIIYLNYDLKGYKFTPKSKKNAKIQVNEIVVVNKDLIDKILTIKFNDSMKKLVAYVYEFLNDETDVSSGVFALSEIDRLKSIIINKYKSFISQKKEKLFLEHLAYLENQIQMKMMMAYNFYQAPEMEEEQTQGRGR